MAKKESFVKNRIKSINYAFKGMVILIKTEASIKIQLVIAAILIIVGFYFQISTTEWLIQILSIVLVISIEGVNTTIEAISDFIHPEHHPKIGFIKDIAAGAVFIASIGTVVIGIIIYYPKIFNT